MRYNITFDIVKHRNKFFILSGVITLLGILTLVIFGLNLGVDFKSGTTLDITTGGPTIEAAKASDLFAGLGDTFKPATTTIGGDNSSRITARYDHELSAEEVAQVKQAYIKAYGDKVSLEENTVDPELSRELARKAIYAVLLASLFIVIYVTIRFEWRFAIGAIVALLHDAFIVISLFSIFRLEVGLPFIAAVLTIIGYSINDTIVIFDRIRENLRFSKLKTFDDLAKLVNQSIWQTMTRSINTVITVLVGALCLLIFGSISIKFFSLAMIFGLVSGAYSSVFIASPLWLLMKKNSLGRRAVAPAKES